MVDFNDLMNHMNDPPKMVTRHCDMCGHDYEVKLICLAPGVGCCPKCGAGVWEGEGSKMLNELLALEEGLWERELQFVESLAQERQLWRKQGYKPDHLPSEKQINWLKAIHKRLA